MEVRLQVYHELSRMVFILTVFSDFYPRKGFRTLEKYVLHELFFFYSLLQYIHLFQLR